MKGVGQKYNGVKLNEWQRKGRESHFLMIAMDETLEVI